MKDGKRVISFTNFNRRRFCFVVNYKHVSPLHAMHEISFTPVLLN